MADALSGFKFPQNKGLFTTFDDGDEYKLRVLTVDPVVTTKEFTSPDGETNLSTRFSFVVYNFTLEKAQILSCGTTIAKAIQAIHQDEDFGADIQKVDIKISATGSKLSRKYTVNVLPKTTEMTTDQIKECRDINLDEKVEGGQRMSFYDPNDQTPQSGHDKAAAVAEGLRNKKAVTANEGEDDPIDLNDIPF